MAANLLCSITTGMANTGNIKHSGSANGAV